MPLSHCRVCGIVLYALICISHFDATQLDDGGCQKVVGSLSSITVQAILRDKSDLPIPGILHLGVLKVSNVSVFGIDTMSSACPLTIQDSWDKRSNKTAHIRVFDITFCVKFENISVDGQGKIRSGSGGMPFNMRIKPFTVEIDVRLEVGIPGNDTTIGIGELLSQRLAPLIKLKCARVQVIQWDGLDFGGNWWVTTLMKYFIQLSVVENALIRKGQALAKQSLNKQLLLLQDNLIHWLSILSYQKI